VGAIASQNFTCQRTRNFPLASSLLNLDIAVFREAPTDNTKQTTSPGTQLLPLLLYLISLVRPSSSHPDLLLTNPNDPTLPTSEAPYQRYVSNYHMLHLFRSHGMAPASLLHPTLRFSPRALPLLSLHYYCHILHNHLKLHPGPNTYLLADHLLRQLVYAPRNCRHG
jgi:hypothetical protein